jgi:glycosyltransferase involved in cell wall biosynthesis
MESFRNVWLINHYAQEPGGPGGTRHYSLAYHIKDYMWQITIIAASVELNTGHQRLSINEQTRFETISGVDYLWVKTPAYKGSGIKRIVNMLVFAIQILRKNVLSALVPPDVIIGSTVHPFAALAGAILAHRYKVPFIFEVRDLWPQTLIEMGRIKKNSLYAFFLRRIESYLCNKAVKIITLLPRAADYFSVIGVEEEKVVWISNGVELNKFRSKTNALSHNIFVLMYFGAIGPANDLETLLNALVIVKRNNYSANLRVRLIGEGPLKHFLISRAEDLGISDFVFFEPAVSKNCIPCVASEADAFVICVKNLPRLYRYGISMNKLFDYMAAARPIVMSSCAINDIVSDSNSGITVEAENCEALAQAIIDLINMPSSYREAMGLNARKYVEAHFDYKILGKKFAQVLDSVAS